MAVNEQLEVIHDNISDVTRIAVEIRNIVMRIEQKTAQTKLDALPMAPPPETGELIRNMLSAIRYSRKLEAIRAHRALTGWGLKASKDAIEEFFP